MNVIVLDAVQINLAPAQAGEEVKRKGANVRVSEDNTTNAAETVDADLFRLSQYSSTIMIIRLDVTHTLTTMVCD